MFADVAGNKPERNFAREFGKKRNSLAEQMRRNAEINFINQIFVEKTFCQLAAARKPDVFAVLRFQIFDKFF